MEIVLLTPPGPSAIAVYLVRGPDAAGALAQCCGPAAAHLQAGQVRRIVLRDGSYTVDDALLVALAPDTFELHLHGGQALVQTVAALLQRLGGRVSPPHSDGAGYLVAQSCAAPSFRQGIGAAILGALPLARTATALELLTGQREHGLTAWAAHWKARLTADATPLWLFQSEVQWLLDRSRTLQRVMDPPRIAIIGPPNAGKSTLVNALLGRPVSITSNTAGTTRDWVDAEGVLAFGRIEVPVIFVDTAGIRATPDPIEHESIQRTHAQRRLADAIIAVVDATALNEPATGHFLQTLIEEPAFPPCLLAHNKADRLPRATWARLPSPIPSVQISALRHEGIDELVVRLLGLLSVADVDPREPFAFTQHQRQILSRAALSHDLSQAARALQDLACEP